MLKFELGNDDRLHFASNAIYQSDDQYACGVLILTDRRLYFGSVNCDFDIEISLPNISRLSVETLPEKWPPVAEKQRLQITENRYYEFTLNDADNWKKKILQRPSAFHLLTKSNTPRS